MKFHQAIRQARSYVVAAGVAFLAACASPPAPPPPVAQPKPVPMRPMPPSGAHDGMIIPAKGSDGVRLTVNAHVSPAQAIWNFRSAYNVAALNCDEPEYAPVVDAYGRYLKLHARSLTKVNSTVENEWRRREGSGYARLRDTYATRVYNYFALPPVLSSLCDAMIGISAESLTVEPAELETFSTRSLTQIEALFEQFYNDFEQYKIDLAAWDARYGQVYGGTQVSGGIVPQPFVQSAR